MVTEKIFGNSIGAFVLYAKSTVDGTLTAVKVNPATGALQVDTELTANIDPTGLATELTLDDIKDAIESLEATIAAGKVQTTPDLPPGAATEQGLDDILAKLPDQSGGKIPVVQAITPDTAAGDLAKITTIDTAVGAKTDAPYVGSEDATARGVIALLKGIKNHIYALAGALIGTSLTTGYNQVSQTTTIAAPAVASGAYLAGDRIGPASGTALSELAGMALANGRGGTITALQVICNKKSITPRIRVHFYNASDPTDLVADNVARKRLYANSSKLVGYVDMVAMSTPADAASSDCSRTQEVYAGQWPLSYKCAAGATSLWVGIETLDGITALDNNTEFAIIANSMLN